MGIQAARLRVRVLARAAREEIVGLHGDAWKVAVTEPPERGRANAAVVRLLAGACGVAAADVRVVAGRAARDKVIEVQGLSTAEAQRRLAARQRKG